MTKGTRVSVAERRYDKVNALWGDRTSLPTLSDQEAISAAKRLFRLGTGKAFKGPFKIGTGNRHTWIRNRVFIVNPSKGWHDLVHAISHLAHYRQHPDHPGHHWLHADYERRMIEMVISKGWLDGTLRRTEKPKPDLKQIRHQRILVRIKNWEAKKRRADNALKALYKSKKYYEDKGA